MMPARQLLDRQVERLCDAARAPLAPRPVELDAARELPATEHAESEGGIRDRRLRAATAVAGGARVARRRSRVRPGAGRRRRRAAIEPPPAPIERTSTHGVCTGSPIDLALVHHLRPAVGDQAGVEARAADVGGDHARRARGVRASSAAPSAPATGPGEDRLEGPLPRPRRSVIAPPPERVTSRVPSKPRLPKTARRGAEGTWTSAAARRRRSPSCTCARTRGTRPRRDATARSRPRSRASRSGRSAASSCAGFA